LNELYVKAFEKGGRGLNKKVIITIEGNMSPEDIRAFDNMFKTKNEPVSILPSCVWNTLWRENRDLKEAMRVE